MKPLSLITGTEDELRRVRLSELLAELGTGPDDFDFESTVADQRTVSEWIASVSTVPFFGDCRTLLVRNLLRLDPADLIQKNPFLSLPETARIILVADDETGDEDRQRRLDSIRKKWADVVKAAKGDVLDCTVKPTEIVKRVTETVLSKGKTINASNATLLVEMVGTSYSKAVAEAEKLILYVGDRPELREADVKAVVFPSREWSIWSLIDAVMDNRVAEAYRQLNIVVGSRSKVDQVAFRNIMPQLSRQLRMVWQARVLLDAGKSIANMTPELEKLLPTKHLGKEHEFTVKKAMRYAQRQTLPMLTESLQAVAKADAQLKGALPAGDALDTLEVLIAHLARAFSNRPAA